MRNLDRTGLSLYQDLCDGHNQRLEPKSLTQAQVDMIRSLISNGLTSVVDNSGNHTWKIPKKKKQGGHLTQKFGFQFFSFEK